MAKNDQGPAQVFPLNPSDRKFARLDVSRANPEVRGRPLQAGERQTPRPQSLSGNRPISVPDDTYLKRISDSTAARVSDSESLFQLLPDTELSMQILVSGILSPKDMVNTDLTFTVESGSMETELIGAMIKVVEEYFDKTYKIKKILTPILQDVLFMTGSYPLLILPENTIDDAINSPGRVSVESLKSELDASGMPHRMGFLGPAKVTPDKSAARASLESIYGDLPSISTEAIDDHVAVKVSTESAKGLDLLLSVSDNPSIMKLPFLKDKVRQDRIQDILSMRHTTIRGTAGHAISLEASGQKRKQKPIAENTAQVEASLYKKRQYKNVPVFSLVPSDMLPNPAVGHPMVQKLPSESVIPVHVPGNPDEHIGYFVMIDDAGNPVVKAQTSDYYTDMSTNINTNQDMVSQLVATTRRGEKGRMPNDKETDDDILKAYTDLVEEDLLNRLRNGIYGDDVSISRPQEVYRVMLARSLAQMRTKLLYVPAELMTYIAFDYNRWGIGASVLEKSRILGSIRAIMLFANTMSMIKNSVAREILNITLDANDKTPTETVEFLIHEYSKTRQASYPVGASNPMDIINFLQNAGVSVAVSGNTGYPETKFEVEDRQSAKIQPNTELMEELKNQHIMSMGLSPETINMGANAEFATTIVNSNLLLTKRVIQYQEKLTGFIGDHIQKYILYSGYLMDALREVVRTNKASVLKAEKEAARKAKEAKKEGEDKASTDADGSQPPLNDETAETDTDTETPEVGGGNEEGDEEGGDETGSLESFGAKDDKARTTPDRGKNAGARIITDPDNLDTDRYGEDAIIFEFIKALKVSLPAPDTVSLENQMKAFELYQNSLDTALKAYVDTTFLNDSTLGDLAETVEATIAVVRAYYCRQWLRKNNVLTELDQLTNLGADGEAFDLLDSQEAHMEGLMVSIGDFMNFLRKKQIERGIKAGVDAGFGGTGAEDNGTGTNDGSGDGLGDLGDLTGDGTETSPDNEGALDEAETSQADKDDAAAAAQEQTTITEDEELDDDGNPKKKKPATDDNDEDNPDKDKGGSGIV